MSFFVREGVRETIQINSSLDVILKVRNESGSSISVGTPLYLSGHNSTLDIPLVDVANAGSDNTMPCIGIAQERIGNGSNGHIKQLGKLDYDTSSLGFTLGDSLYVSTTGTLTNESPVGVGVTPQTVAIMGYSNADDGFILVKTIGSASTGSNIDLLDDEVVSLRSNIQLLESNVVTIQGNVVILEGNVATITSNITTLESNIVLANSNMDLLESNISTFDTYLTNVEGNISIITGNINVLENSVSVLESNISIIEGNVSILESNISVLEGNITVLGNEISTYESNINTLESNISTLESNISVLEGNVNVIEGNVSVLEGNVSVLEGNIAVLEGNVSVIESNITVLESNISTLETNYQSIQSDFIGVHISYVNSNLNLDSEGNINLITGASGNVYVDGVLLNNIGSGGGTELPVLGDSNIYIGNGSETSQVSISGDIKLINTGATELISISNSSTISSTANIQFDTSKGVYFNDTNKYMVYDGSNLDINLNSGNIRLLTGSGNLYIDNVNTATYFTSINNDISTLKTSNTSIHGRVDTLETNTSGITKSGTELTIAASTGNIILTPKLDGRVVINSNLSIIGNLSVIGNTTVVQSNVTVIDDPVIELGISDSNEIGFDRGIKGNWYDGGNQTLFFGMERDSKKFKYIPYATFDSSTGNVVTSGDTGAAEFGNIFLNDSTESYSVSTGSLLSNGGAGITSNLYVGGNVFVAKELYINDVAISPRLTNLETSNGSIHTRVDTLETSNLAIYDRVVGTSSNLGILETSNTVIYGRVSGLESNVSNIVLTGSNLDISSYGNINIDTNIGNVFVNGTDINSLGGGSVTGITYTDPHLFLESGTSGNIVINAESNVNLGTHTIISNTFTMTQLPNLNISGTQNITLDFNDSSDYYFTLASGASLTLNNPSNTTRVGQQGSLIFKTAGTGHSLSWASGGKWYFNSGLAPSLTGTNGTVDIFSYIIVEPSIVVVNDATNFQQY